MTFYLKNSESLLILFSFLGSAYAGYYEDNYAKMVVHLQTKGIQLSWEYGLNDRFRGMSKQQMSFMGGALLQSTFKAPVKRAKYLTAAHLPTMFDARQKWFSCQSLHFVRDQSNCASSWAVAAASVMSDRICVATNGHEQQWVSDQFILSCCRDCGNGCKGGHPDLAFSNWIYGYPTGGPYDSKVGCQPYAIQCPACQNIADTPLCSHQCLPDHRGSFSSSLTYGQTTRSVYKLETPEDAMAEIAENGPVVANYELFDDFYYYRSGVYEHVWGESRGGHAVRVIGWGEENGVKYWLATNSWNTTFGIDGHFKIKRGDNMASFESFMYAGLAYVHQYYR